MTSQLEHWKLPTDWELTSIGNKFVFTHKPRGMRLEDYERIPFIPMDRIPSNRLFFSDFALTPPSDIASGTYFEEGDLLVSKITPCFENGKQGIVKNIPGGFGIATTEVIPIKPINGVSHLPFLAMYLLHPDIRTRLAGTMEGATGRQRLPKAVLEEWSMPFPPLPEQHVIAAVLSKILVAVELQDKIVATLKELKTATMAKLFREGLRGEPLKQTEIGEIPEHWNIVRLGKIAHIGNGSTPKRDNPSYWENGNIPWLTSAKVHESIIEFADEFVTDIARAECHLPLVRRGSIVVAITGQGKTLGNAALVTFDTCVSQHLAYIQLQTDEVFSEFMLFFLQGRYGDFRQVSRAGGSTKGALTCGFLKNYAVPVPPFEEQRQIARTIVSLAKRLKAAESRRQALSHLFSSMLHLLMTGQVRV